MSEYRKHTWIDIETMEPVFGIQKKHDGKWLHVAKDGKGLLFRNKEVRDAELKRLKEKGDEDSN